jgi:hypothetical protein
MTPNILHLQLGGADGFGLLRDRVHSQGLSTAKYPAVHVYRRQYAFTPQSRNRRLSVNCDLESSAQTFDNNSPDTQDLRVM